MAQMECKGVRPTACECNPGIPGQMAILKQKDQETVYQKENILAANPDDLIKLCKTKKDAASKIAAQVVPVLVFDAGMGSVTKAYEQMEEYKVIMAIDSDKEALKIHKHNYQCAWQ